MNESIFNLIGNTPLVKSRLVKKPNVYTLTAEFLLRNRFGKSMVEVFGSKTMANPELVAPATVEPSSPSAKAQVAEGHESTG